jgi:all-trans-retinol 13,14-reductase
MENLYHPRLKDQKFDAIIIGSGLGGLTTAALMAKSGKKVLILEKHYVPGGFTHTFRRGRFRWDVGVHYVGQMGQPDALMKKIFDYITEGRLQWQSTGHIYDRVFIEGDHYDFVCGEENQIQQLLLNFPSEETAIRTYFKMVRQAGVSSKMFFGERTMPHFLSKYIGFLLRNKFYKLSDKTTYEVLKGLTENEKLISVLCAQCGNYGLTPQHSSFAIQAIITEHFLEGGNYPCGGASGIAKSILNVIKKNNGTLALKAEVAEVLIKKNKAFGVKLINGDELKAPIVISGTGARNTFIKLLPPSANIPPHILLDLQKVLPSTSHLCLYIGLNASDQALSLPMYNYWMYDNYNFDEAFNAHLNDPEADPPLAYISFPSAKDPQWQVSNPGTSTIQIIAPASYQWIKKWEGAGWQKRGKEYEAFKEKFKLRMLDKLYRLLPEVKGHVTVCEVSTPLSTKHFSGHPEGEIYGMEHTPARFRLRWLRVHTPVRNFYLTGQDITTVGVGGALFSGVLTASSILKKNFLWHAVKYKNKNVQEEQLQNNTPLK